MPRKHIPVAELKSGARVESCYLLQNYQVRPKKDGSSFVTLVLKDASGKITGIMWDNFELLTAGFIKENDYVEVAGDVLTYQSQLQFKVNRISRVDDSEVNPASFLPVSPVPLAELEKSFHETVARITDPDLTKLVGAVFGNPVFWDRFRRAPSAVSMHQAYIGGLLEHTLCVVKNALKIADNYPATNRSLLITGGLLHDIGKTVEYVFDKKIAYSDMGRLIGHISIAHAMVELECSRIPDFPLGKKVLVQHIMLSHHGYLEFGSPKRPKTLEALILHHADQLDAQLSNYLDYVAAAARNGTRWEFSSMFDRYMFGAGDQVEGSELMRELSYHPHSPRDDGNALSELENAVPSNDLLGAVPEEKSGR